ncbi:Magnesium transporter MRS2-I [Zea mays]|uniref:Magnesium transporter n=1 Tax=Zea mays TaxID=4577 RepID=A0A317Y479_MAIZE|nr:Magnesium transporter MRS2-I [Zea mays]
MAAAGAGTGSEGKKRGASRSWILLDAAGEEQLLDADKYAIMRRVDINARDLRILDPLLSYPSTILGRERAIVLNLEVLLRDPSDENVIPVVEELHRRLAPSSATQHDGKENLSGQHDVEGAEEDESPFEFRALEVTLEAICSFLDARTTELETDAYPALDELTSKISSRNLDRVRIFSSVPPFEVHFSFIPSVRVNDVSDQPPHVRDELEQLLDDDDDMADLYLSRKLAGASSPVSGSGGPNWFPASPTIGSKISRASRASAATVHGNENDVEELEMLLEAYFMQVDGTLNKLTTLREYIDDTEDYINIQLDNHRNQLIQLELFLSSGTVCLSLYSLVAGVFGMNIPYTWNDGHGYIFKWVVLVSGLFCAFIFVSIVAYARHKGLVGS